MGAIMSGSRDQDISRSDQSSDEEFVILPLSPQFVPKYFEDLEDALWCPDSPPDYQTGENKDNSSDDSDGDNSEDNSSDHGNNWSHDDPANDVYKTGYVKLQKEGVSPGDIHLHNRKMKLDLSSAKDVERNGKTSEVKEVEEDECKECEARSQDQEASSLDFTLVDDTTKSALLVLENSGSEGSSDEFFVFPLPPSFDLGRYLEISCPTPGFEDLEDDMLPVSLNDLEQ